MRNGIECVLVLLVAVLELVAADVSLSKPLVSQNYTVSDGYATVELDWIESNAVPLLNQITKYVFTICTGPNGKIDGLKTLATVAASDLESYSYNAKIPSTVGTDGSYYIQVYAQAGTKGYTIHYSNRFYLTGMTGTKEPSGGEDLLPPSAQTQYSTGTASVLSGTALSASFKLQYTDQTGITRYAPMQMQPGSKVTKSTWSRQFVTSSISSYYSTIQPSPQQSSTITPGWSYTISSAVNYASPAQYPSQNGGWYNPSSRLSTPSLLSTQ